MTSPQPWVKYEQIEESYGKFVMSPLKRGMGTTLGNSMRRVLLSSLSGSAVVAVTISGVEHEFASLPYVVEDTIDLIRNLKGVIFQCHSDDAKVLDIEFSGPGKIKAKDIKADSDVSIINKDHYIAEVNSKETFSAQLVIQNGVGYQSSESLELSDLPVNAITLDASFSPIIKVNHSVENIRVGKELDYDSLNLEVWTDGSVTPDSVVQIAASILTSHITLFNELNEKPTQEGVSDSNNAEDQKRQAALNLKVDDLELSARSLNCLKKAGIESVSELVEKDESELIQIKNFGKKSALEINEKLSQYSLALKGDY